MDVIAMAGAGFGHAVAPMGTALTEQQLALLWRMAPDPILCFDGDAAGLKAAHRAVETALPHLEPGQSLRFALLPAGEDPDDLIRREGAPAMSEVLESARPLADMLWGMEMEREPLDTPERRAAFEQRLRSLLQTIADRSVRTHYGREMANRLERFWDRGRRETSQPGRRRPAFGFADNSRPWQRGRDRSGSKYSAGPDGPTESLKRSGLVRGSRAAPPMREALIMQTLLNHPTLIESHAEELATLEFESGTITKLRDGLLDAIATQKTLDSEALRHQLNTMSLGGDVALAERAITHSSDWFAKSDASVGDAETGLCHILALHRRSLALKRELAAAERAFQDDVSEEAYALLCDIRSQITNDEGTEARIEGFGEGSGRTDRSVA